MKNTQKWNNTTGGMNTVNNVNNHLQTSMYATNGSLIKDFISKKEFSIDESTERRPALINRYGFIAALIDGFNSDGNKRLEISLPESADFSINQNGGFSVFFWFLLKKQSGGVHRFLIKRGNSLDELTPSIGILPNGTNLFIKMNSSKHRIETLFSNKKIETNRMYSLTVTFSIDYENELTDISLFLDGLLDSQITVPGEPLHNQGNLYVGKSDSLSYGFVGTIADVILVPRVLNDQEIFNLNKDSIINLNMNKVFGTYEIFAKKFERDTLIEKYSLHTGNPAFVIENLELNNDELREIVKKFDQDLMNDMSHSNSQDKINQNQSITNDEQILNILKTFLGNEDSDESIICKKLTINARFIYTVLFLANNQEDEMDVKRIIGIFEILKETLHLELNEKLIKKLADILYALNTENKFVKLQIFFKNLRFYISHLFSDVKSNPLLNYSTQVNNYEMRSIELHENLLLSSQTFKNNFDDDLDRDLGKSYFTIRSLYPRTKSGRPMTGKGMITSSRADEGDMVNQQFENIPEEKKNEFLEEEEMDDEIEDKNTAENPNDGNLLIDKSEVVKNEILNELKEENKSELNIPLNTENNNELKPEGNVEPYNKEEIENKIEENAPQNINNVDQEQPVSVNLVINNIEPNHNEEEKPPGALKSSTPLENHSQIDSANTKQASLMQTNFDDIISNFENKVMIKSSDRDNQNRFLDPDNMIAVNNLGSSRMEQEDQTESKHEIIPKFSPDWNEGEFEIVINHCFDCHLHKTTTRHLEYTFVDKFNEVADFIKALFPNSTVLGNVDKPDYLGCFDIYLRGVGPRLDDRGRYFIFRKIETKGFPNIREVGDKLVALAMLYGSSVNMEAAQTQYLKAYQEIFGNMFKGNHEHPLFLSEDGEKTKEEYENKSKKQPVDDPERTKLFCQNWGCGVTFVHIENGPNKCNFHPGVWQFGSQHGYWPEAWSCCEKSWDSEGCTTGPHKSIRLDKRVMLCVNHGDQNPKTEYPDSACGALYTKNDKDPCKYHSGYVKGRSFSCCGSDKDNVTGCQETSHQTAEWPDEKAKLYFYPKPLNNPGLKYSTGNKMSVGQQVARCGLFKPPKAYDNPITKMELLKIKRDKEKDMPRYCLNWACEKPYLETENKEKSCRCHPGKWDHGSTGTKMSEFVREMNVDPKNLEKQTILWKPHWTCCRKDWHEVGCRTMKHRGILLEKYTANPRKYKWPDMRLKLYFTKIVSDKWKIQLQKYMYPEHVVKAICKKFFGAGKKTLSDLPSLCDELRLYLLVVSDNIEYQMKFMDIATQSDIAVRSFVVSNYVEGDKFTKWWFTEYEKICETVLAMPEKK